MKFLSDILAKAGLVVDGVTQLNTVANATTDTDKFLVSDGGVVKYRTGAQMASDIGPGNLSVSTVKHLVKLGVAASKGQAVYVSSADGTNMIVSKASNATEATSSKTIGLLETGGILNDQVYVITEGLLAGLDTSTTVAGAPVWLGTDGNLIFGLANKPYAPAHLVFIGIVTRAQQNNGEIFVKVQNGFELDELHNVQITATPADNTVLSYELSSSLYKMKSIATLLGYTPANAARNLTINGVTYDLSADRTWTITAGVSSVTAGTGISVNQTTGAITVTNTGLLSGTAGTGISVSTVNQNLNIVNTGLLSATAGTGISVSTVSQNLNIVNTGLLSATAGVGISVSTTSQNVNIVNTGLLSATAGAGISVSIVSGNLNIVNTITDNNQLANGAGYATTSYVTTQINNLVAGAPGLLDTLDELAAALGDDPNFATTITTALSNRLRVDTATQGLTGTQQSNGRTNLGLGSLATLSSIGNAYITDLAWSKITGAPSFLTAEADTLATVTARGATTTAAITVDQVIANNNGNGTNYKVGDDLWIGDVNLANTVRFMGNQNNANAYIIFGNGDTTALGRAGTGALTYGGNTVYHSGNLTNLNQLTNGPGYITGYTETDTLATVTGRGATTSTTLNLNGGATIAGLTVGGDIGFSGSSRKITIGQQNRLVFSYQTFGTVDSGSDRGGWMWNAYYDWTVPGYKFLNSNGQGASMLRITNDALYFHVKAGPATADSSFSWGAQYDVWHSGNLTNLSQLTNGPGYITGYTETDTLATVTGRGNTTTGRINVRSNGNQGGGNILMGNTGNGSSKWSYLTGTHYNQDTQTQGVSIIGLYSDSAANTVVIGGSIYEANPATEIQFWTHTATTHNLGGSKRMVIDTNGNVGVNINSPLYRVDISGSLRLTGALVLDDTTSNVIQHRSGTDVNTLVTVGHGGFDHNGYLRIGGANVATQSWVQSQGYLTSVSDVWVNTSGDTMTGELVFSMSAPQIRFADTDHYDHWIHVNSNRFYVLSDRNGDGTWETPYPMELNSETNTGYIFGGTVWTSSNLTNLNQLTNGPGYVTGGPYIPVSANTNATGWISFSASTQGTPIIKAIQQDTSAGYYLFQGVTGSTEVYRVDRSGGAYFAGSVGVGNSSPSYKLDVSGQIRVNNGVGNGSGAALLVQGSGDVVLSDGGSMFWGAYDYGASTYIRAYDNSDIMYFYSNGTNMAYFRSDRAYFAVNVGIGTSSPSYTLHVSGTGYFNSTLYVNGQTTLDDQVNITSGYSVNFGSSRLHSTDTSYFLGGNVGIGLSNPGAILDVSHTAGTTNIIRVSNGAGNYRWRVDQFFNMYMTNASGVDTFSVTTAGALTATSITETSTVKIKENIAPVTAALEKVDQLQPVSYNKKGSSTKEIGLIAEDVFDVYPEFVLCDDNGEPVGIHYSRLTAVLIESVKELKTRIQELEKRN